MKPIKKQLDITLSQVDGIIWDQVNGFDKGNGYPYDINGMDQLEQLNINHQLVESMIQK